MTNSNSALLALAERVEAATWADPALAREIAEATKDFRVHSAWNPLASLDEAMSLVPEGCTTIWDGINGRLEVMKKPEAYSHGWTLQGESECKVFTLALCAAALRARSAQ